MKKIQEKYDRIYHERVFLDIQFFLSMIRLTKKKYDFRDMGTYWIWVDDDPIAIYVSLYYE